MFCHTLRGGFLGGKGNGAGSMEKVERDAPIFVIQAKNIINTTYVSQTNNSVFQFPVT